MFTWHEGMYRPVYTLRKDSGTLIHLPIAFFLVTLGFHTLGKLKCTACPVVFLRHKSPFSCLLSLSPSNWIPVSLLRIESEVLWFLLGRPEVSACGVPSGSHSTSRPTISESPPPNMEKASRFCSAYWTHGVARGPGTGIPGPEQPPLSSSSSTQSRSRPGAAVGTPIPRQ